MDWQEKFKMLTLLGGEGYVGIGYNLREKQFEVSSPIWVASTTLDVIDIKTKASTIEKAVEMAWKQLMEDIVGYTHVVPEGRKHEKGDRVEVLLGRTVLPVDEVLIYPSRKCRVLQAYLDYASEGWS